MTRFFGYHSYPSSRERLEVNADLLLAAHHADSRVEAAARDAHPPPADHLAVAGEVHLLRQDLNIVWQPWKRDIYVHGDPVSLDGGAVLHPLLVAVVQVVKEVGVPSSEQAQSGFSHISSPKKLIMLGSISSIFIFLPLRPVLCFWRWRRWPASLLLDLFLRVGLALVVPREHDAAAHDVAAVATGAELGAEAAAHEDLRRNAMQKVVKIALKAVTFPSSAWYATEPLFQPGCRFFG